MYQVRGEKLLNAYIVPAWYTRITLRLVTYIHVPDATVPPCRHTHLAHTNH
jgi:hypothetical protein